MGKPIINLDSGSAQKKYQRIDMKKSKISFCNAWLVILVLFILTPIPCLAENITAQATIQKIDIAAQKIARKKSSVNSALRNLKLFAKGSEAWFGRLDKVNAQIRKAQKSKGEYVSFNRSQLDDALQQLKNERAGILKLNGGVTIGGQRYTSMDKLKSAYGRISQEETQRHKEHKALRDALEKLDKRRDAASSQLEKHERHDLDWNKTLIKGLKDDIRDLQELVNDNKMWCVASLDFMGKPMTRRQVMHLAQLNYIAEIEATPGKKFNSKELERRILYPRDQSNQIKKNMRTKIIPEMRRKIEELRSKVKEEASRSSDISGCWIIFVSDHDNPMVNITKDWKGGYSAYISKVGVLDHIGQGHLIFSVLPVNKTVFEGIEYGTDANGKGTTLKLRLVLSKDGNRMDYRSDDILTMGRCR
jgi:hypothetical protein